MPAAEVVLPDKKVHRTVLDDPPQRLIQYLDNKLGLKQPLQASELRDSLVDILADDEARFERLTQDIYKIYEDYYARDGDPDGKVSLEEYRESLQKRLGRKQNSPDNFEGALPGPDGSSGPGDSGDQSSGDEPDTDKDQEIFYYQLAIGALALFLLISIAR